MEMERRYPDNVEVDEATDAWARELIEELPSVEREAYEGNFRSWVETIR